MNISVSPQRPELRRCKPDDESKLGFGRYFSNHMFLMDYHRGSGWTSPRIVPYGVLPLEASAAVFHYAQEIFENHKVFKTDSGEPALFRANDYMDRMTRSAERMCMPAPPREVQLEGLKQLIRIDRDWIPSAPNTALNVRHAMIATEPFLGVRPSNDYLLLILTGPVGAYFSEGFSPVRILVEDQYIRAAQGGTGQAKTGGNYAASLKAQHEAKARGYSQVLWLDAKKKKFIEEVGAMNIFFKFKDELVTPPLTGTILPGITRNSILTIAKDMGLEVNERPVSIDEVMGKVESGELEEVFGTGTAAVVSPVGCLGYQGKDVITSNGQAGPLAQHLLKILTDIQLGLAPDPHGWLEIVT